MSTRLPPPVRRAASKPTAHKPRVHREWPEGFEVLRPDEVVADESDRVDFSMSVTGNNRPFRYRKQTADPLPETLTPERGKAGTT